MSLLTQRFYKIWVKGQKNSIPGIWKQEDYFSDWLEKSVKEMKRSLKSHDDVTCLIYSGLNFSKYSTCDNMQILSYLNLIKSINKSWF